MGRKSLPGERTVNPARKRELAEGAWPFFMQNGLKDATMDNVAHFLGKSKATIYKYFPSREDLVKEGLFSRLEGVQKFIPTLQNENADYIDRYFRAMEQFLAEVGDITNLFLTDLKTVMPELWQQVETFRQMAQMVMHQFYVEGIRKGKLKPLHPAILAQMDQFLFDALTDGDFLAQHNLTMHQAFTQYFEMKFFGIAQRD